MSSTLASEMRAKKTTLGASVTAPTRLSTLRRRGLKDRKQINV